MPAPDDADADADGLGVETGGKISKSSFNVVPGLGFWEQAAFNALTSVKSVSHRRGYFRF